MPMDKRARAAAPPPKQRAELTRIVEGLEAGTASQRSRLGPEIVSLLEVTPPWEGASTRGGRFVIRATGGWDDHALLLERARRALARVGGAL